MRLLDDVDSVARHAAELIATEARAAVRARGRITVAISGGRTPWVMLCARDDVPWQNAHVLQVDERVAPAGHADRNLTQLRDSLRLICRGGPDCSEGPGRFGSPFETNEGCANADDTFVA